MDDAVVAWVPIKVNGRSFILPLLCIHGELDLSVLDYMSSPAVISLSQSALSHRAGAIRLLNKYRLQFGVIYDDKAGIDSYSNLFSKLNIGMDEVELLGGPQFYPRNQPQTARIAINCIKEYLGFLRDKSQTALKRYQPAVIELYNGYGCHLTRPLPPELSSTPALQRETDDTWQPLSKSLQERRKKTSPVPFPERYVRAFFQDGLQIKRGLRRKVDALQGSYNIRNTLYFLLLAFGGLRASEPLHLFTSDIQLDLEFDQICSIFLYHPAKGPEPFYQGTSSRMPAGKLRTRQSYLKDEFGLVPRISRRGRFHAGWKNLLLEETVPDVGLRSRVYWQNPVVGALFWRLHEQYISEIRPQTNHPYYLVSLSSGASFGQPWTEEGADTAFRHAVAKLGLQQNASEGICRHAFRHRLGQWLVDHQIHPIVIQQYLHQQSPMSQLAYTRPQPGAVNRIITNAWEKLDGSSNDEMEADFSTRWRSDPLGLFEGPSEALKNMLLRNFNGKLRGH